MQARVQKSNPATSTTHFQAAKPVNNKYRHDHDVAKLRVHCAKEHQGHQQTRASGGGSGQGEQARVSISSSVRHTSPSPDAIQVSRWPTSSEGLSNSASVPSALDLAGQDRAMSTCPDYHHNIKVLNPKTASRGKDYGRSVNETNVFIPRSNSMGSTPSQARAQTVSSLRRASSSTSEAFGNGGSGCISSSNSTYSPGVSVTASSDPDVLKVEIHRLQAALMNEFKGRNRFIGGAQFKASNNSRGGNGGAGGNTCGGCLQVCVCSIFSFYLAISLEPSFFWQTRFLLGGAGGWIVCAAGGFHGFCGSTQGLP